MPSFRVTLSIGALLPGVPPQSVLPAVTQAANEITTVEASDLAVVQGSARVTVRFTANDSTEALRIANHVRESLQGVAQIITWQTTQRIGGRWYPLP